MNNAVASSGKPKTSRIAQAEKATAMELRPWRTNCSPRPCPRRRLKRNPRYRKAFAGAKGRKVWKFEITDPRSGPR